eukprot:1516866-Pyramimonas_sp.AAC.1
MSSSRRTVWRAPARGPYVTPRNGMSFLLGPENKATATTMRRSGVTLVSGPPIASPKAHVGQLVLWSMHPTR